MVSKGLFSEWPAQAVLMRIGGFAFVHFLFSGFFCLQDGARYKFLTDKRKETARTI